MVVNGLVAPGSIPRRVGHNCGALWAASPQPESSAGRNRYGDGDEWPGGSRHGSRPGVGHSRGDLGPASPQPEYSAGGDRYGDGCE